MADHRDRTVVIVDAHLDRHRPDVENQVFNGARPTIADALVAREHPRPAEKKVGARRHRPAALAPRHGVRAEVATDVGAELVQLGKHAALDAGDIGDKGVRMLSEGPRDRRRRDIWRHRDHDEAGSIVGAQSATRAVIHREPHGRRRHIGERHVDALLAEGEADARAKEARADDVHLLVQAAVGHEASPGVTGGASASASASASATASASVSATMAGSGELGPACACCRAIVSRAPRSASVRSRV